MTGYCAYFSHSAQFTQHAHEYLNPAFAGFFVAGWLQISSERASSADEEKMERSPDLLASIVHYCVKATAEWELNISSQELFQNLSEEKAEEWPLYLINGHIYLLADAGYIEMSDDDLIKVVRITWAGYDYLDSVSKRPVVSDNPFMAHG